MKEIYEGDILRYKFNNPDCSDEISVCTYGEHWGYGYGYVGFDLGNQSLLQSNEWEIIGNINENAHLTEKK